MAPQKRDIEAAEAPLAKRRIVEAAVPEELRCVMEALGNEQWMPASISPISLKMLAAGAPHALAAPKEDRHATMTQVLSHIRAVLSEVGANLAARTAAAKVASEEPAARLDEGKARLEACIQASEAADKTTAAARQKRSQQLEVVRAAEREVKAGEAPKKDGARERAMYTKEMDKVIAVRDGNFKALVEGAWPSEKEGKKICDRFTKEMEKFDTEPSLLASAPAVLLKKPEERKPFDEMTIDSLRVILQGRIDGYDSVLQANDNTAKDLEEALVPKRAAVESAKAVLEVFTEEFKQASAVSSMKLDAHLAAHADVDALASMHGETLRAISTAEEEEERLLIAIRVLDALVTGEKPTDVPVTESVERPVPDVESNEGRESLANVPAPECVEKLAPEAEPKVGNESPADVPVPACVEKVEQQAETEVVEAAALGA